MEKERTNALEVAKKAYEKRKAKETEEKSLNLTRFSYIIYSIVPKQVVHIISILKIFYFQKRNLQPGMA